MGISPVPCRPGEKAHLEERQARVRWRNEDLLQSLHSWKRALPGVVPSQAEQDDAQLVKASQQGEQGAFALLVQRHQRRVFNLCLRLLQDDGDANETTQEVFAAAWQGLLSFRGEACFPTWLSRIAVNCCLRQLERRKREHALQPNIQAEQRLEGVNTGQADETIVRKHLEHLPTTYRMLLVLRHLHDMTYEEIADMLTLPVGTVKTQLFRARTLLKERLLAQHLVTRGTASCPLTGNKESMHTSRQSHAHGSEQNSNAVTDETEDVSQQRHVWQEQQQGCWTNSTARGSNRKGGSTSGKHKRATTTLSNKVSHSVVHKEV